MMTYSIRLPKMIENRLEKLSVLTGRKKSYLAEKGLKDIRAGRTQTIPLQDVMNALFFK